MARHDDDDDDDRDDRDDRDEQDDLEESSVDEEAEPPVRPKTTLTATILILLNLVATGVFLVLLFIDYQARQEWTYAVFRNHVAVWGLPLKEEEQFPGFQASRPRLRLTPEELKAVTRPGTKVTGAYAAVEEPIKFRILPSQLTEDVQKDIFQGVGTPVGTLEQEVERVKTDFPARVEEAAKKAVDSLKTEAQKRQALKRVLLPLAWDVYQVDALQKKIEAAKGEGLDKLLDESLQRRIYLDVLAPLNVFRPGDAEKFIVEKASELDVYTVAHLKELFEKRCAAASAGTYNSETHFGKVWDDNKQGGDADKRDSIEKRQQIAFLLFALAQAREPLTGQPLTPDGLARAQTVVGLYETALAMQSYAQAERVLEGRVLAALNADRQGYVFESKGGLVNTQGFVEKHSTEVERSKKLVADVEFARKRLADLQSKHMRLEKVHEERETHLQAVMAKLTTARAATAKQVEELRELQAQLFEAQSQLADAANRNFRLEAAIRAAEKRLRGGK